jgi:hypothetical protein
MVDLDYTSKIIDITPLGVVFIDLFKDIHIKANKT